MEEMNWISIMVRGEKSSVDFTSSPFLDNDNAFNKFNNDQEAGKLPKPCILFSVFATFQFMGILKGYITGHIVI